MDRPFADRVALITGAGSGIGRQLALTLARQGASIGAVDLRAEPLTALAAELSPARVASAVADVTDHAALLKAAGNVQAQLGPVDLLIANAGIGIPTPATDLRAADIEAQVRVNLIGVANSVAAVLPGMIERRRGHLVAISSLASFRGLPRMAGYCAAKAGVNALMDSLRVELKEHGIAVTTICPGWIRTPLTSQIDLPQSELMPVEEAADRIIGAIRRRSPFHAFPARAARRVGLLRWLPCSWSDWVLARMLRRLQMKEAARNNT